MDASKFQNLDNVPEELRRIPFWFLPAYPGNTIADIKKPRLTGWQLPENNANLDEILSKRRNMARRNGVGLNLLPSDYFFLDFDHVIAKGDNARSVGVAWKSGWVKSVYDSILDICPDCFIERSMSGSGLHLFLPYIENMDVPAAWYAPDEVSFGKDSVKIEVWARGYTKTNQHCFVTGDVLNGNRVPTKEETAQILEMIDSCSVRSGIRPKKKQRRQPTGPRPDSIPDLGGWLEEHGVGVSRVKEQADHILFELEVCPFDDTHRRSSYVIQYNDNGVHFDCHHHSCNHSTKEFFDSIEEGAFDLFRPKPLVDPDSDEHWDYLESYITPKKQRAYSADDGYWKMLEDQLSLCEREIEAQDRRMEGGYKNAK